jgi:hypothetical protein
MRQAKAQRRRHQDELNRLGARFAAWAHSHGYPPARQGNLGFGWAIGSFGTTSLPGDPSQSEYMSHSADHATWFVLQCGMVGTTYEPHQVGLPNINRFIAAVREGWGCDLAQPTSRHPAGLDMLTHWTITPIRNEPGSLSVRRAPTRRESWLRRWLKGESW